MGIGAWIGQGPSMDDIHLAAFYSRKFKSAEMNYFLTDKETLAVIDRLSHFQPQLSGTKFMILTDHMAALAFPDKTLLDDKHARWLATFNTFDCEIKYLKGTKNVLTNALSRYFKKPEELPQLIKPQPTPKPTRQDKKPPQFISINGFIPPTNTLCLPDMSSYQPTVFVSSVAVTTRSKSEKAAVEGLNKLKDAQWDTQANGSTFD